MEVAGWVGQIIREDKPAQINIDVGGLGVGVYDRLVEQGHGEVVTAINFGGKPVEPPPLDEAGKPGGGPANRRAEMWSNLKEALVEGRLLTAIACTPISARLDTSIVRTGASCWRASRICANVACRALTKLMRWRCALPAQSAHQPLLV